MGRGKNVDPEASDGGEARTVTSNDWKRVKELFTSVVALAEDERDSYLAAQSDSNEVLNEVRSLLSNYLESPDFLEGVTPPLPLGDLADETPATLAGRRIGAWQLIREIGRGGMGVVWEARRADQQYDQRAAVKLLRASLLSEREIRRFREERQILASLNHPCIARLLDGGMMEDGSPYLVMEYVDGQPLDAWCEREQLNVRQRLEIFLLVCSAVEYAHRQLVIHRDLKPANILVTASDGVPKLLDFGIAKLIQDGVEEQPPTTQLLTPACASPEQVRGERMTTADDIFSLGVLLYSLLTGHHPFAVPDASPLEAMRAICEMEPRLPSSRSHDRRKQLHGELDAVILQALRKNPTERYPSVRALADDVRAWLEGSPVSAVRQSWGRRFVKLIWRYKAQSAAVALAAASLLGGMMVTSIEAKHARRSEQEALLQKDHAEISEHTAHADRDRAIASQQAAVAAEKSAAEDRNRANNEAATASNINNFLEKDLLAQASPEDQDNFGNVPDPDIKVRTALDRAAERIQGKFTGQPLVEASIRETIGKTYYDLDLFPQAQRQLERAVELQRKALGEDAPETLESMQSLAQIYREQSQYAQAESLFKHVMQVQRRILGEDNSETLGVIRSLAEVYYRMGRYPEAESILREVIEKTRRLHPENRQELLRELIDLANAYAEEARVADAESVATEALGLSRRLHGENHPNTMSCLHVLAKIYRLQNKPEEAGKIIAALLAGSQKLYGAEDPRTLLFTNDLAAMYRSQGRFAEAADLATRLVETSKRTNGPEHELTLAYECNLAAFLEALGRFAEAEQRASKNLETLRRVSGEDDIWAISTGRVLGILYKAQGRYTEAEPLLLKTLDTTRRVQGAQHLNVVTTMTLLGTVYLDEGKDDLAETTLTQALALGRKLVPGGIATRSCLTALARLRLAQRKYAEAESLLREAMSGSGNQNMQIWDTFDRQSLLGASFVGQGKYADAEPLLLSGYEGLQKQSPAISVDADLPEAGRRLVQLYTAWGKPDQAGEWRRKLSFVTN